MGGSELHIDVKLIGPEGKLHLQLQQKNKTKKNEATYLSVIGPDSRFITEDAMFTAGLFISGGSLRRRMKTSFLYGRRQQSSLTVLFACYININYSTERSADKQPGLFYLICKNISLAFLLYFIFVSLYLFYHIFGERVIRMHSELKSSLRVRAGFFEVDTDISGLDLLFCANIQYPKNCSSFCQNISDNYKYSVFPPGYSWRCGESHTH